MSDARPLTYYEERLCALTSAADAIFLALRCVRDCQDHVECEIDAAILRLSYEAAKRLNEVRREIEAQRAKHLRDVKPTCEER